MEEHLEIESTKENKCSGLGEVPSPEQQMRKRKVSLHVPAIRPTANVEYYTQDTECRVSETLQGKSGLLTYTR